MSDFPLGTVVERGLAAHGGRMRGFALLEGVG
jgi:hypothetical protein